MTAVTIVVSVDWEGRSLLDQNREAIRRFRTELPHVPLQHFLNAAYYIKGPGDRARTSDFIAATVADGDECGLHIHAWHSLVAASGVTCRDTPRFIDARDAVPRVADDWGFFPPEDGYDVPITAYHGDELDRIIATSQAILRAEGFPLAPSFRAGGWMSAPHVQAALVRQHIGFDCSPVDPRIAARRFGDMPLCRWLAALWPDIDGTSQPRMIATGDGRLWQVPDNAALIDYMMPADLVTILGNNIDAARSEGRDAILVTGFHQETARLFLPRLAEALKDAEALATREGVELRFEAHMSKVTAAMPEMP